MACHVHAKACATATPTATVVNAFVIHRPGKRKPECSIDGFGKPTCGTPPAPRSLCLVNVLRGTTIDGAPESVCSGGNFQTHCEKIQRRHHRSRRVCERAHSRH